LLKGLKQIFSTNFEFHRLLILMVNIQVGNVNNVAVNINVHTSPVNTTSYPGVIKIDNKCT